MTRPLVATAYRYLRSPAFELIGAAVGLLLLAGVLRTAVSDVSDLRFSPAFAVMSVAVFGLAWMGLATCWAVLLDGAPNRPAVSRWFRTQLFRYIPGGIWAPMARVADPDRTGREVAKKVGLETLAILSAGAFVGAVVGAFALDGRWAWLALGALVGLAVSFRLARGLGLDRTAASVLVGLFVLSMVCYAVASVFAQRAVTSSVPIGAVAAAGLLSWVAGFVVVIAPGGLGAKEWAYLALLSALPQSNAAAGAIAGRLCFVIAELITLVVLTATARPNAVTGRRGMAVRANRRR